MRGTAIALPALVLIMASSSGCATIANGTSEKVHINSDPAGAQITIDSGETLTTPVDVDLARGQTHTVVFHKDGYQDETTTLTSGESGKVLGNILIGGIIGVGIDEASGAAKKLSTDDLEITLVPVAAASVVKSNQPVTQTQPATSSSSTDSAPQKPPSHEGWQRMPRSPGFAVDPVLVLGRGDLYEKLF
jgi:hypothetical protein